MAHKKYIVSAPGLEFGRLAVLARQLRDAGITVTQVLDTIGIIVGYAEEAIVPTLLAVPGVAAIEEERDYSIPPPDSDVS